MGGANGWRFVDSSDDYFRQNEKRLLHEERRPRITSASDLLGPGAGPHAVQIQDWNMDEATFNGLFFSAANRVINSPDNAAYWMGQTMGTEDGYGLQTLFEYRTAGINDPIRRFVRRFATPGGSIRLYSDWVDIT